MSKSKITPRNLKRSFPGAPDAAVSPWKLELGANVLPEGGVSFAVWAPHALKMEVALQRAGGLKTYPMTRGEAGYFFASLGDAKPGDTYFYLLNGEKKRPDPVSRSLPDGIHGASMIVDPGTFRWNDAAWKGLPFKDYIFYELHTGTFTLEGTFEAVITKIPHLKELGVTCVELMPVAQFPGERNWGYDGASPYAVQNSYGGPEGLKRLVDACHRIGLAVCLDVVYNHLGPEGNYLHDFGPYFSRNYQIPWGDAINYDGPDSDPVRRFFLGNALYWVTEYHVDALRIDAIHGIFDFSAKHFLEELNEKVKAQARLSGRQVAVIAESDLNDARVVRSQKAGGHGLDAQWSDDFHHALHVELTGESQGYYRDFSGLEDLAKIFSDHFAYDGRYSVYRQRRHGNKAGDLEAGRFVVYCQNHDLTGNRAMGERLSALVGFEALKAAAALMLLSPYTPLLWMGEEYGETAPFHYFIDHGDAGLAEAVRQGRRREFAAFGWTETPDPQSPATFERSRLNWQLLSQTKSQLLLALYRDLIRLRRSKVILSGGDGKVSVRVDPGGKWLCLRYQHPDSEPLLMAACFSEAGQAVQLRLKENEFFSEILNTADKKYGGPGRPGPAALSTEVLMLAGMNTVAGTIRKGRKS